MQKILQIGCAKGIADTYGGELISYTNEGKEYIWTGDPAFWNGHAPVLFPFVSALKDWKVKFGGKEYSLTTKHGFARKSEFELVECTDTKITFALTSSEKTKEQYPFDFRLLVAHEITEQGYTTTYTVCNTGTQPMLFCIGGHAGYCVDGSAEDYQLIFEQEEDLVLYYTDAQSLFNESYRLAKRITGNTYDIVYDDFDVDAIILKAPKSHKVKLVKKSDGTGLEFDYTGFENLTLWTPPKKQAPFFCLEPWNGLPAYTDESGNFEDKPGHITLEAGQEYSVSYSITVLK